MRVVSSLLFGVKYEDYSQRDSISDTSEKLLLGYSLYFAPNKTWLASLTLCLKKKKRQQLYSNHEEGTQCGRLAFASTLQRTGALLLAEASCTHLPPRRVQANLGESPLVLGSLMLVDDPGFYLAVNK